MSSEYYLQDTPAKLEAPLIIAGKRPVILLYCTKTSVDNAARVLAECSAEHGQFFYTVTPLPLARRAGLVGLLSAFTTAYANSLRGCRIARATGLDTILYLLSTRNLRDAIEALHALDQGVQVVLAEQAPPTTECLARLPPGRCSIPRRSSPREEARQAVFPVDAKACKGRRQDANSL